MGSAAPRSVSAHVRVGAATHTGRRRTTNQDFMLVRRDVGLFVVADGVGGRKTGDVASSLTAMSMKNFFEATEQQTWPDGYRALLDLTLSRPAQRLSAAIRKANADVWAIASTRARHRKMNTTVVAAHLASDSSMLHVGHVGDSRCYRLRAKSLGQLTRDHTLRNEALIQYPNIAPEHLDRIPTNMLARAIGRRDTVELELRSYETQPGDTYLLCSDGVTCMLDDATMLEALMVSDEPQEAAHLLVALANEAGGLDNITAMVLRF